MRECNLPTRKECFEIIEEFHVPSHILRHSLAVAKLAVFLAERLKEKGIGVDVELLDRACLLHDIARVCDFKELDYGKFDPSVTEEDKAKWAQIRARYAGIGHEEAAYDILKQKYPTLALTIKKHRYMAMLDEKARPDTWEEKLVYYADMRVMEDRIVPLKDRLEDGHKRNVHLHGTKVQSRINTSKVDPLIYRLETEIFDKLGLQPLEITDELVDLHTDGRQPKE
jgi:putative nucleotidyltransferase with HDIG domain